MAGRKRKPNATRQPGGRIDHGSDRARRQRAEDMRQIALEARTAVFGVSRTQASEMPETSSLGVLMATNGLSDGNSAKARHHAARRYEAARRYRSVIEDYDRLHPIRGYPHSSPFDKMGGHDDSDGTEPGYRDRSDRARRDWNRVRLALCRADKVDHRASGAIERIVLHDYSQPHLVDALKVALDHVIDGLDIP